MQCSAGQLRIIDASATLGRLGRIPQFVLANLDYPSSTDPNTCLLTHAERNALFTFALHVQVTLPIVQQQYATVVEGKTSTLIYTKISAYLDAVDSLIERVYEEFLNRGFLDQTPDTSKNSLNKALFMYFSKVRHLVKHFSIENIIKVDFRELDSANRRLFRLPPVDR